MKSTRRAYGEFLESIGSNEDVVVFDADLAEATQTKLFKKLYPLRHIDVGIAEQDLIGMASGMALTGKKVFASSFAMFLCGRAYEQIRNTVCYSNININLCATHSGLGVGEDGATHQMLEDIALMNVLPNMKIFCPADDISTKKILEQCIKINGPKYIRLGRQDMVDVYSLKDEFVLGGSHTFGKGIDATIFACGSTLSIALEAKKELEKKHIYVRVVDLYCIKPINKNEIGKCAIETKKLISIEDHSTVGGIGSIVESVLCEKCPKKLVKLGVKDSFGKSGKPEELYKLFNITKEEIIRNVKEEY